MQKPSPRHQVGKVSPIKSRRRGIQGREVVVSTRSRACPLQGAGELRIDVGVVIYAGSEERALCLADGVSSGECNEVSGIQAFALEAGDEIGETGERGREVAVSCIFAGSGGVPPPQLHRP